MAFKDCFSLNSISVGNSIIEIGKDAFAGCNEMTSVNIANIASWCKSHFAEGSNPLYYASNLYLNGSKLTSLQIPNSITEIEKESFAGCTSISAINIPTNVDSISSMAFGYCNEVTSITFGPNKAYNIGKDAFIGCNGLQRINISDIASWCRTHFAEGSNPLLYANVLYNNGTLVEKLVVPNTVTAIEPEVFVGCTSLTSLEIPATTINISSLAFMNCSNLSSIEFNDALYNIGENTFTGCNSLTGIHIANIASWCKSHFAEGSNPLIYANELYLNNDLVSDLHVPETVDCIESEAFSNCMSILSITIPGTVNFISAGAFRSC